MRKNLFLTLALALLTVAGAWAQDWSHTISVVDGLPGVEGTTQYTFESKLFTLPAPTTSIRYTVVETEPQKNNFFALAELTVLDKDGNEIAYTASSNADQNSLGAADGAGLPALNDGNLGNYFHSSWSPVVEGYHWIEMTFAEPISEFSITWATRPNQHQNKPLLVGLTPGGVDYVPYQEFGFSQGAQITTTDALAEAKYILIKGNAPAVEWDGMGDDVTPVGPRYQVGAYNYVVDPEVKAIAQLIPNGDGTYIVYWVNAMTYLHDSGPGYFAKGAGNGWQYQTSYATAAANVKFRALPSGDFEMSYDTYSKDTEPVEIELFIAQDVRHNTTSQLKTFEADGKADVEAGLPDGNNGAALYGLPAKFNFTIYEANVNEEAVAPYAAYAVKKLQATLATEVEEANALIEEYGEYEGMENDTYAAAIAAAEALSVSETATLNEVIAAFDPLDAAGVFYLETLAYYYEELITAMMADDEMFTEDREAGKYPVSAIKDYLEPALNDVSALQNASSMKLSLSETIALIDAIEAKITQFEASIVKISEFPAQYIDVTNELVDNNRMWTSNDVILKNAVNGIRITFLKNNSNHLLNGYPQIVLAEFELYDENGDQVTLEADDFASNSVHPGEGCLANLCNGAYKYAEGVTEESYEYWHSKWSGSYEPAGYVYLDVTFPAEMDIFKFKMVGRDISNNRDQQFPVSFVLTEVGEAYDPLLFAENPYDVTIGDKITSIEQLTDGYYVLRGMLNTHPEFGADEEGNVVGTGHYYTGINWFHASQAAVRENSVYHITTNEDGTRTIQSIGTGKYWPTFGADGANGYRGGEATYKKDAAKLHIEAVAAQEIPGTFVMYEKYDEMTRDIRVIEGEDTTYNEISTPYALYMDWDDHLAVRAVVSQVPGVQNSEYEMLEYADNAGDSLHFAKMNGESQWEIYPVTLKNADYVYLKNLVAAVSALGVEQGTNPGQYADLGNLPVALAAAEACVNDSVYAEAAAKAEALEAAMAVIETAVQNPIEAGKEYMLVSALDAYYVQQNVAKALYMDAENMAPAWGNIPTERNEDYVFVLQAMTADEDGLELDSAKRANAFAIYNPNSKLYVGAQSAQSQPVPSADYAVTYVAKNVKGSRFAFYNPEGGASWSLHTNQHGGGAGTGGNIVYWNDAADASQWKVMSVESALSVEDLAVEGAEVVSVSYFTPAGAQVPAPVKGINIVVVVYTNGVVETKKVLVK